MLTLNRVILVHPSTELWHVGSYTCRHLLGLLRRSSATAPRPLLCSGGRTLLCRSFAAAVASTRTSLAGRPPPLPRCGRGWSVPGGRPQRGCPRCGRRRPLLSVPFLLLEDEMCSRVSILLCSLSVLLFINLYICEQFDDICE